MTFNRYPIGWAHAMDTPFQWTKQVASHFGGTRNALAISWPARIKARGEIRSQFHHVIDIMPTILEAAGLPQPVSVYGVQQEPVEGLSMVYTFDDADAKRAEHASHAPTFQPSFTWLCNEVHLGRRSRR
jgi:arylsulfatase